MVMTLVFEIEIVKASENRFYLYHTDPATNELFRFSWEIDIPSDKDSNIKVSHEEQRQTKEWITNQIGRRGFNVLAAENAFNLITNYCKGMNESGMERGFLPIYRERIGA